MTFRPIPHAAALIMAECLMLPGATRADVLRLASAFEGTARAWGQEGHAQSWLNAASRLRQIAETFPVDRMGLPYIAAGHGVADPAPASAPPGGFIFGVYRAIPPPLATASTLEIAESLCGDLASEQPGTTVTVVQAVHAMRRPLAFHQQDFPR